MFKTLIVVDQADDLAGAELPDIITFEQYLADYPKKNERKTRLINLCDTRHYLSRGYKITEEIQLTTSLDILESITHHDDFQGMIALGYAGWGPGQLEKEISDNVWLSCPANSDILFDMPVDERMQAAAGLLGIKLNQLTAHSGHA